MRGMGVNYRVYTHTACHQVRSHFMSSTLTAILCVVTYSCCQLTGILLYTHTGNNSECRWCQGNWSQIYSRSSRASYTLSYPCGIPCSGTTVQISGTCPVHVQWCFLHWGWLGGYSKSTAECESQGPLQSGQVWNWVQLSLPHHWWE